MRELETDSDAVAECGFFVINTQRAHGVEDLIHLFQRHTVHGVI